MKITALIDAHTKSMDNLVAVFERNGRGLKFLIHFILIGFRWCCHEFGKTAQYLLLMR